MGKEKIILGVDPGTNVMGFGLLLIEKQNPVILKHGVIHLKQYGAHPIKLKHIYEHLLKLIDEFHPDEMALEAPFYGKNIQSMLKLGRAQGVAMASALTRQIPIVEYAPKRVKQSVTGNGNASKEQVAKMIQTILRFDESPKLLDATDALAVALCHFYQKDKKTSANKKWSSFVRENPDRIG